MSLRLKNILYNDFILHPNRYAPYPIPASAAAAAAHAAAAHTHSQPPQQQQQQQQAMPTGPVATANPYHPAQGYHGLPNVDMSSFQGVDWISMYGMGMYV